jgi:hypothetical protein
MSIASLTLPTEPLDAHAIFVVAAFMISGFEECFKTPELESFPQLALEVFRRLDPAQKCAVSAVLKEEAETTARRCWESVCWNEYIYHRGSTARHCGLEIARLLMHWSSQDRLPSPKSNQPLQLETVRAGFADKVPFTL